MKKTTIVAAILTAALLAGACGDDAGHAGDAGAEMDHGDMGHAMGEGTVPGAPASASDSTRDIEIAATDAPAFDPSTVTVSAGEVVTFVVRNDGETEHEFVLGDEAYQEMHEHDMQTGEHMMGMDNALTVAPGETEKLTWEFDEPGEVLYGCHEPGHFDEGMVGTITIN